MILSSLVSLYERFANDSDYKYTLPPMGWSSQNIAYWVVLKPNGELFEIEDARIGKNDPTPNRGGVNAGKPIPRTMCVLGSAHPSGSAATPRFLWDQSAYLFGFSRKSEKDNKKAREVLFPAYRDYHFEMQRKYDIKDAGYGAVLKFLRAWNPTNVTDEFKDKVESFGAGFGVFRIQGEKKSVFETDEILDAWERESQLEENTTFGDCLITGKKNVPIVPVIETKIKLPGTAVGGGAIVSFNASAYESYGKSQTLNAPISKEGGFKAHNALNILIRDDRFHIKVAGTTVVFWTERKTNAEGLIGSLLGMTFQENAVDEALVRHLSKLWHIIESAGDPSLAELDDDVNTPFYMLGIEPNAARIVIRFWYESTLGDLILKLRQHHQDMKIDRTFENEPDHIPLWQIVRQTARDADGVPPLLSAALLRAVIQGLPYPASLYQLVLNRINVSHTDQNGRYRLGSKVTYLQAAIIKGFLVRNKNKGEITMSLNTENKDPAYLLGRLFATLEKTQAEALGDLNAGIGDKYYSAASATPRIVFPTLLDMFRKHLKKLSDRKGLAIVRERLVGEILDAIDAVKGFPANLSLGDRGTFALGYYQQMRVFFTKKENAE